MSLKELKLFKNLWIALKQFFKEEEGLDKSSILAYYSIFSSLFLLTFFTFLFTRFLGDPDITLKSVYPFSPDFFSKISPDLFKRAAEISGKLKEIGVIGILFSFILGFLVVKKIVQFVNNMFDIDLKIRRRERHFLVRRISEFGLLFCMGLLVVITFLFSGFITTITTLFHKNEFIASHINPEFIEFLNNFLLLYLVPFLVTFFVFFCAVQMDTGENRLCQGRFYRGHHIHCAVGTDQTGLCLLRGECIHLRANKGSHHRRYSFWFLDGIIHGRHAVWGKAHGHP